MEITKSKAFSLFKNEIGQVNHFLITILIGLDGVKTGKIKKEEGFNVCWNPKNVEISVARSREYSIKSSLAFVVDCIDMYLRLCNRQPVLFKDGVSQKISRTGNSVYRKFKIISEEYTVSAIDKAAVDLLICWRNRMIHFGASNNISNESREILKTILDEDKTAMRCHLDGNRMLQSFDDKKSPKFKEIAFMVNKTISFVENLDKILLSEKNIYEFLYSTLHNEFKMNFLVFNGVFSTSGLKRKKKITELIRRCGVMDFNDSDIKTLTEELSCLSYQDAKARFL